MKAVCALGVVLGVAGCALTPPPLPPPCPLVPSAWLEPCRLPELPTTTGELADAFVAAMQCAEQGNRDKARIAAQVER